MQFSDECGYFNKLQSVVHSPTPITHFQPVNHFHQSHPLACTRLTPFETIPIALRIGRIAAHPPSPKGAPQCSRIPIQRLVCKILFVVDSFVTLCHFYRCSDVYEGGVAHSAQHTHTSSFINNTFFDCVRVREGRENTNIVNQTFTTRQPRSVDTTFTDCTFTITASSDSGGAIYSNSNGISIVVLRCVFTNGTATDHGGAICVEYITSLRVLNSTFTNCHAFERGSLWAQPIVSCLSIRACHFGSSNSSWAGAVCLGLGMSDPTGVCEDGSDHPTTGSGTRIVVECVLQNCSSSSAGVGGGGGLYWNNPPNTVLLRGCEFLSCKATDTGGGMIIRNITNYVPANPQLFFYCFFDSNTLTNSTNSFGTDVFLHRANGSWTQSPLFLCFSTTLTSGRLVCRLLTDDCPFPFDEGIWLYGPPVL